MNWNPLRQLAVGSRQRQGAGPLRTPPPVDVIGGAGAVLSLVWRLHARVKVTVAV